MEKRMYPSRKKVVWIADYDLTDQKCSQQFYRHMRKLMGQNGLRNTLSTRSVVVSEDEKLARAVHNAALQCGRSNLYVGRYADVGPREKDRR